MIKKLVNRLKKRKLGALKKQNTQKIPNKRKFFDISFSNRNHFDKLSTLQKIQLINFIFRGDFWMGAVGKKELSHLETLKNVIGL